MPDTLVFCHPKARFALNSLESLLHVTAKAGRGTSGLKASEAPKPFQGLVGGWKILKKKGDWLVAWNMNFMTFPSYWEFHHPNWQTLTNSYLSEGWLNHQPAKKGEDHGKICGDFHEANGAFSESVENGKSTMTGESMRGTCWNPSIPGVSMDQQVRGCLISSNHPSVDGFDSEMVHLTAKCNCKQSCILT